MGVPYVVNHYSFSVINRISPQAYLINVSPYQESNTSTKLSQKTISDKLLIILNLNCLNFYTNDLVLQARCVCMQSDFVLYICLNFSAKRFSLEYRLYAPPSPPVYTLVLEK